MTALTQIKDQAVKIFNTITDTGGNHLTPVAKLSINGKPFNTDALSRIISISLTDKSGFEADELTVSLSDHDGKLALPPKSAEITIALGYIETGIVDKGSYKITEVSWSGAPDTLHITAQSADTSDRFSEAKEKSWHKTSLKEIIESIAAANGYTPIIGKAYQDEKIDHIDQSNESDAAFLSRLAERYDAIATVKHGRLLFVSSGEATTAGGSRCPQSGLPATAVTNMHSDTAIPKATTPSAPTTSTNRQVKSTKSSLPKTTTTPSKKPLPPPKNTRPSAKTAKPTKPPPKK